MNNNTNENSKDSGSADVSDVSVVEGIKHPLERPWAIWHNNKDNNNEWGSGLVELTTFDTVEDYWCLYHHIKRPSELPLETDYAVFKKGIQPTWEDKMNAKGGRWVLMADKYKLNELWLDIVLLMIGENFEDMDMICGVVVNVKQKCKIVIWTTNTSKRNIKIAEYLKNKLNIKRKLDFQAHNDRKILYSY
ncbi:eukaryotic translation initiation factor 4E1-like [Achroia grisella]|uniref:eukaryotic translation initiation factor 4E1-like n=1 Tax=Achroia grisella TaxID=688607 RepID=UPI0027D2DB76|nr:eukaryotic translation initiation factor 4E1-like [Achroia grisella]